MKYLAATDGSEHSKLAVEYAVKDAVLREIPVEIIHVLKPRAEIVDGEIVLPGDTKAVTQGTEIVEDVAEVATQLLDEYDTDIEITTTLQTGYPPDVIVTQVEETEATRLYLGHRNDAKQTVGSVAKTVLDKVDIPVMIVRD